METGSGNKRNSIPVIKKNRSKKLDKQQVQVIEVKNVKEEEGQELKKLLQPLPEGSGGDVSTNELPPPKPEEKPMIGSGPAGSDAPEVDCEAVIKKHLAARKIQSRFRGWLVRTNMGLVTRCVIRIQSLWRGALVRQRRKRRLEEKEAKRKFEKVPSPRSPRKSGRRKTPPAEQNRKETTRQKDVGDGFGEGPKTDATAGVNSPQRDNGNGKPGFFGDLDRGDLAASHSSTDSFCPSEHGDEELRIRMEKALQCLETILKDVCREDLSRISKTRVAELIEYMDTNPTATKEDVCLANSLAKICPTALPAVEDDLGGSGVAPVKSDPEKARLLKDAIRLLRQRIQACENRKLYPYHHLARTKVIPGIYSDPFSGELTDVEKKLMDLRFGGKDADSYVSPAKFKTENAKQLKELMKLDPDEKDTMEKIYNFKFNYFPEPPTNNGEEVKIIEIPKSPPPFTTLFKANPKRRR